MPNKKEKIEEGKFSLIGELAKKALFLSLGTVFMTEEGARSLLKEYKLPKDIGNFILQNAQKGKEEFYGLLTKEFKNILAKTDFSKELKSFLREHTLEVKVNFSPKPKGRLKK